MILEETRHLKRYPSQLSRRTCTCYVCGAQRPPWAVVLEGTFSHTVCRACCNFEGANRRRIEVLLRHITKQKDERRSAVVGNGISTRTSGSADPDPFQDNNISEGRTLEEPHDILRTEGPQPEPTLEWQQRTSSGQGQESSSHHSTCNESSRTSASNSACVAATTIDGGRAVPSSSAVKSWQQSKDSSTSEHCNHLQSRRPASTENLLDTGEDRVPLLVQVNKPGAQKMEEWAASNTKRGRRPSVSRQAQYSSEKQMTVVTSSSLDYRNSSNGRHDHFISPGAAANVPASVHTDNSADQKCRSCSQPLSSREAYVRCPADSAHVFCITCSAMFLQSCDEAEPTCPSGSRCDSVVDSHIWTFQREEMYLILMLAMLQDSAILN